MTTIKKTTSPSTPPPLVTDPLEIDALSRTLMNSFGIPPSNEMELEKLKEEYMTLRAKQGREVTEYVERQKKIFEMMTNHIGVPATIVKPGVRTKDEQSFEYNGREFLLNRAEQKAMSEIMDRRNREMFDKMISPRVFEDGWPVEKIQNRLDEIYAEEKDMDPTWEFDLEAGAFKSGDIVTDVDNNKFFVSEKGLQPMDDKAEHAMKTNPSGRGTLRLMASVHPEAGVVDEGVAKKPSYTELTMKSFEDAIGKAFEDAPDDFVIYTGTRGRKDLEKAMEDAAAAYPLTMEDVVKEQQHLVRQYGDHVSLQDAHTETLNEVLRGLLTGEDYDYDMTPEDVSARISAIQGEINSRRDASEVHMLSSLGIKNV